MIAQNGNAYDEGLRDFWILLTAYWKERSEENASELRKFLTLDATKWQWTHGVRNANVVSPDTWTIDQSLLDRPGNGEIQLELFYSYGSNCDHRKQCADDDWLAEPRPSDGGRLQHSDFLKRVGIRCGR